MTKLTETRVRFAPAPTGMMHLGNVRTALMNFLFSRQKKGTFILRIEDTDGDRNFDPGAVKIQEDLAWLSLTFDEGPQAGGPYGPYFQSQRTAIYQEHLQKMIDKNLVYRCFCSSEELEKKRQRQIALKQPPRYDRTCYKLSAQESLEKSKTTPFIWRMYVDHSKSFTIHDVAHGAITFEMKNFSDFPLTRQDGSVTFIFANFIDDALMKVSCAIRGEDHLSNTASQAALYDACGYEIPRFWHMPILCNIDGKKLSKRDFGFSLRDLKEAGFLPEAILNYLAIIGGSFQQEVMSIEELINAMNFESMSATGQIKYDVEKLRWINQKWIARLKLSDLEQRCRPYLETAYSSLSLSSTDLQKLLSSVAQEMITLQDAVQLLDFYFTCPSYSDVQLHALTQPSQAFFKQAFAQWLTHATPAEALEAYKKTGKESQIPTKQLFSTLRFALTGRSEGIGAADLITLLNKETINERLKKIIELL